MGTILFAILLASLLAWSSVRKSTHLVLRATADPLLSIALGLAATLLPLVIFNLFNVDPIDVLATRAALFWIRTWSDVPRLYWVLPFLLMVLGRPIIAALWPRRVHRWIDTASSRLKLSARVLSIVHIAAMTATLFAFVSPIAAEAAGRDEIRHQYELALQKQFDAKGLERGYKEAVQASKTMTKEERQPLQQLIVNLYKSGQKNVRFRRSFDTNPGVEKAQELGEEQAKSLGVIERTGTYQPSPVEMELKEPIRDRADLNRRTAMVLDERKKADAASGKADEAKKDFEKSLFSIFDISLKEVIFSGINVPNDFAETVKAIIGSFFGPIISWLSEHYYAREFGGIQPASGTAQMTPEELGANILTVPESIVMRGTEEPSHPTGRGGGPSSRLKDIIEREVNERVRERR